MAEKGEALSTREQEVLQCVIDGAGNKEIANTLSISPNTVKVHLRNIYTKLDVSSRTEATTVALQKGIIALAGVTTDPEPTDTEPALEETAETVLETAVSHPQPAPTPPVSRPAFFPRWVSVAVLGLLLLVAVIVLAIQTFGEEDVPEQADIATPKPFAETVITNDWLQSRPLAAPRSHMALVGNGLNLYLIGGETEAGVTNNVSILNTSDLVWQQGADKPTAVTNITGAELFGEIYIPGGQLADGQPTNGVEVYSPANDTWRATTPLPTAVSDALVLADGSFIYLFGGWDGQNYLADVYRFDPANSSWQILPAMPTGRAFAAGGVIKGQLYVVGGYDGERPLTDCTYFDPTPTNDGSEGSWHTCADTLLPRAGASATGLFNKLYLFGGGAFGAEPITYSESYDPDTDQWSVVNTPQLDDPPSWQHLGITYIETKIYAVGGVRGNTTSADLFVYRPLAYQTFIPIAPVESNGSSQ